MGLLSPVIILAKLVIQQLWQLKTGWDENVPPSISKQWDLFRRELSKLSNLSIPRQAISRNSTRVELHGFSDASMTAYGGCVYFRSFDDSGSVTVRLLCSKAKVAPLKALTIPRLELCAALTLAKLVSKVSKSFDDLISGTFCWSDSMIVLGWINTSPHLLDTFVSNRVSEIQSLTQVNFWNHISTENNPADLLSRGIRPSNQQQLKVWFNGPSFLNDVEFQAGKPVDIQTDDLPEMRKTESSNLLVADRPSFPFDRFSKLLKIQRTFAYCQRGITPRSARISGPITARELHSALIGLVKIAQRESFPCEYDRISKGKPIESSSKLSALNPFINVDGTLRVGGRLKNSDLSFDKRHPMILSSKHKLTELIFEFEHERLLHAGPQLLLASLRERFWTISGRNLVKRVTGQRVKCFRIKPKAVQPMMGTLPPQRVMPSSPFKISGVDYAGPFLLKDRSGRGAKITKCYIALFICFTTKCIHLELVTALSTEFFMMALRRFISRRGRPSDIYSDQGTNFVGANSELKELGTFLMSGHDEIISNSASLSIQWHFNPPRTPHFGGLWEAGVKSVKYHLKRVLSKQSFTYEQFDTILVQVEAVLNSRPLTPMSDDPNDLTPLTPSHFLVANTLTSLPEPDLTDTPVNRLSKYQHLQLMVQQLWKRWSKEYVSSLQERIKWRQNQAPLPPGTLVIVKEDNLPPQKWLLGRIVATHP